MKLTQDQIAEIKKFIHSRGFTTIELEMEILDHVASAVETKLEDNPNKSIAKAIQEVHAGFGPLGFSVMEDEFRNSFRKYYQSMRKSILLKYLEPSKLWLICLIIVSSFILSALLKNLNPLFNLTLLLGLSTLSWLILHFYFRKAFKQWRKKSMVISGELSRIGLSSYVIFYTFYYLHLFFGVEFNSINTLAPCLALIFLSAIYSKECIEEVFNWTNERYLKYATH